MKLGWDSRYATPPYPGGFDFAMFKATEGDGFKTEILDKQVGGLEAGMAWGVWHYWRYRYGASEQAKNFYEYVQTVGVPKWIVLDCEDTYAPKRGSTASRIHDCIKAIEDMFLMKPKVYTAAWWWNPYVGAEPWQTDYDLWVAHYTTAAEPTLPTGWFKWWMWQHQGDLTYPGFSATIDLNRLREEDGSPNDLESRVKHLEEWASGIAYMK